MVNSCYFVILSFFSHRFCRLLVFVVHQTLQCKISPLLLQVRESFRSFAGERNFDNNGFARRKTRNVQKLPISSQNLPLKRLLRFSFLCWNLKKKPDISARKSQPP